MRAEQVTGSITYHGEGPVWSDLWAGCGSSTCWRAT